ncbi:MAG: hypothetical protein ACYSYV_09690 [Planctomycetota bacterium]
MKIGGLGEPGRTKPKQSQRLASGRKLGALSAYPNYPLAFVILRRSRRIWANAIEILHFAALRSE